MYNEEDASNSQLVFTHIQVYAHRIGTAQEDDVLIYEEMDDTVFVDITSTKDMVRRIEEDHEDRMIAHVICDI